VVYKNKEAIKKNEIFADKWMELEIIMLSEIRQLRVSKIMFSLICGG
jgi:hypothetical protein